MLSSKLASFLFLSIISITSLKTFADTTIPGGNVSGTWTSGNSPYLIQGDITIPIDSTLNIEPGVDVIFEGHFFLKVQGRLLAIGTAADSILFSINDTTGFANPGNSLGGWNGIKFMDVPAETDSSKLIYCKIIYGKAFGDIHPDNCGGGLFISNFDKVLLENSLITNCRTAGTNSPSGGAVYLAQSDINLVNNVFSNNKAWDGGAILIWECAPEFYDNLIINNTAEIGGGGIWNGGNSNPEFNSDIFQFNKSGENGGGIICWQNTNTTLNSVKFIGNESNWGAGVGLINCEIEINNCEFDSNKTINLGGGLASDYGIINIYNSEFVNNRSDFQSGAIHAWQSELSLSDCKIDSNYAETNYGGIGADSCTVIIDGTEFLSNSTIWGGGLAVNFGTLELTNSNFVNNSADHGGGLISGWNNNFLSNVIFEQNNAIWGGAMSITNCDLEIDSCLFFQNNASDKGGAIQYISDTINLASISNIEIKNSKFEENTAFYRGALDIEQLNSDTSMVSITIDHCEFIGNEIDRGGNLLITGHIDDFLISNSNFKDNSALLRTSGCLFNNFTNGQVNNCIFISNSTAGGGSAVSIGTGSKITFVNNTIYNNTGINGGALSLRNNGHAVLLNNIIWENEPYNILLTAVNDSTPCSIDMDYNNLQYGVDSILVNDTVSAVNYGNSNIDSDPIFKDEINRDFHLQDSSQCIASGIDTLFIGGNMVYSPSTDIEGNPRPNPAGTMPDIGAYESPKPFLVSISDDVKPSKYILSQNYPNPFNPITIIKYSITKKSNVVLKVFDLLGCELATIVNEEKPAGNYEVKFDASKLPSGVYFYRLLARDFVETKKMALLK